MDTASLAPVRSITYKVTPTEAHNWAICGGFFASDRREGKERSVTYPLLLGTAVHELIVAYDRAPVTDEELLPNLVTRHWRPGRFPQSDDSRARAEATEMLTLYHTTRTAELVDLLAGECFIRTEPRGIGDGLAIALSGRIDRLGLRVDGTLEVLDFKTGSTLPSEEELRADPATTAYHLLAASRFPADRIVVAQWSLRSGARSEVALQPSDIIAGKGQLRTMVREMHGGAFSLNPGVACGYCPAQSTCPALAPEPPSAENEW
ncbi:MAG TPA: PD-(D/E)XK nuclease family protein [Chloroflexota bacterium]|nr:PD-(D/E)XK nuclease family protein [Chloroflexota bacterium]